MEIKNISTHDFIINGIKLTSGKVLEIEDTLAEKLAETNKGEIIKLEKVTKFEKVSKPVKKQIMVK